MNAIKILTLIILISSLKCLSQNKEVVKGIGVIYLKKSLIEDQALSNSMKIYNTEKFKNVDAEMHFNPEDRFDKKIVSKKLKEDAVFEFGYESFGLPILESYDEYVMVLYGYDLNGKELVGYIPTDTINYGYRIWNKFFLEGTPIFLNRDLPLQFFDKKKGKELSIEVKTINDGTGRKNYIMYPLSIEGEWMKVKLVTPSDYCEETESNSLEVWIKYLDTDCKLRVWYYVRGC
ncbi:MAG: hypothetical protein AAF363_06975 [Bacteroidota bacterium]